MRDTRKLFTEAIRIRFSLAEHVRMEERPCFGDSHPLLYISDTSTVKYGYNVTVNGYIWCSFSKFKRTPLKKTLQLIALLEAISYRPKISQDILSVTGSCTAKTAEHYPITLPENWHKHCTNDIWKSSLDGLRLEQSAEEETTKMAGSYVSWYIGHHLSYCILCILDFISIFEA